MRFTIFSLRYDTYTLEQKTGKAEKKRHKVWCNLGCRKANILEDFLTIDNNQLLSSGLILIISLYHLELIVTINL